MDYRSSQSVAVNEVRYAVLRKCEEIIFKKKGKSELEHAQRLKRTDSAIAKVERDACTAASRTCVSSFDFPWPRRATAKLLTA